MSITINLILIPRIGVIAAPIALSVSYMVMNIYLKVCTRLKFFNNLQDAIAMVLFLVVSVFPLMNFDFPEIALIGLKTALYIVAMAILFWVFKIKSFICTYTIK